jgi:hypothetical protein
MKTKTKQPKLITVSHTAIGVKFSPGNPSLVTVAGYAAAKLSPRLAKFFAKVAKGGKSGIKVKGLGKDDRWTARFLLKIKALREIAEPKATAPKKRAAKKSAAKKPARASTPAKAPVATPATATT